MKNYDLEGSLEILKDSEWKVKTKNSDSLSLDAAFTARYPSIPKEYISFIRRIDVCSNATDTSWFLCKNDYNRKSNSAFHWNEFELQSIEAADKDQRLIKKITDFWNQHLSIMLSVKFGYSFLGIIVSDKDYGKIVFGYEPEYEDIEIVSNSFNDLIALFHDVLNEKAEAAFLINFL